MNNNNLVSVIIPIYNAKDYIVRSVNSLLKQSYSNLEIILVNDGSTDDSLQIIKSLSKKDNRIKIIDQKNSGSGSARNSGIENSSGAYIMFLDSDDYIETCTIEEMMKFSRDYDIVCCGFDRVDDKSKKVFSKEMINIPYDELTLDKNNICETSFLSPACWGKIFKREVIGNVRFSNNTIEDILFFTQLMPNVKNIKFVKKVLWHYMVNSNSLIMSLKESTADAFEDDLLKLKKIYEANNYENEYYNYLTLQAFIHDCISLPSRMYGNGDINIKLRIKHIKVYMNTNFELWKNMKIHIKGRFIKKTAIHFLVLLYKINMFIVFLFMYNFMINKLKLDIKW